MLHKNSVKIVMATVLGVSILNATQKIDINVYDFITIYKNTPDFIAKMVKQNVKFGKEGTKIVDNVTYSCKDLGFTTSNEQKFHDHVSYHYTKQVKNNVEAVCDENIFKGGTHNFAILIDGND